jgi:transposase
MQNSIGERWEVVSLWLRQEIKDLKKIVEITGKNRKYIKRWVSKWQDTGNVLDNNRSGRKKLLSNETFTTVVGLLQHRENQSSRIISKKLTLSDGKFLSPRTVRRGLRENGYKYKTAIKVPSLTKKQMKARIKFCKANCRRSWRGVMFTDSKIFPLFQTKSSSAFKYWGLEGETRYQTFSRDARKLHVYAGVTEFGVTRLRYSTPSTGFDRVYVNKKTGETYRGVCAEEYQDVLRETLIPEGYRLFKDSRYADSWILQQDGAKVHTAVTTKDVLDELLPNRVLRDWPANSPDLSWIENMWAIADHRLRQLESFDSIEAFKAALEKVWSELEVQICQSAVRGMRNRMAKCIANAGGNIGK